MSDTRKTVSETSLLHLVKRLSSVIKEKRDSCQPDQLTAEWTKKDLIVPLLEGLGWDKGADIINEFAPPDNEGRLDLILNCQTPVGIEIRPLHELPPQNIEHPQIKDGIRQCKSKKAPYFIWTNGDTWLFFSLAMANAAFYQASLSKIIINDISLLDQLLIIKKDLFISNPDRFNKAISRNMALMSLSNAWTAILQDHTKELIQVFRKGLQRVDIKDEVILKFLKTLKSEGLLTQASSPISFESKGLLTQKRSSISFKSGGLLPQPRSPNWAPKLKDWERLIDSYESPYRLARWFFRTSYYRKLGEYLISENYKPWSKDSTWRHLGLSNGINEEKKVRHAMILFKEWGFIKETEADKYCRVEGCPPYLKKLLENAASH